MFWPTQFVINDCSLFSNKTTKRNPGNISSGLFLCSRKNIQTENFYKTLLLSLSANQMTSQISRKQFHKTVSPECSSIKLTTGNASLNKEDLKCLQNVKLGFLLIRCPLMEFIVQTLI